MHLTVTSLVQYVRHVLSWVPVPRSMDGQLLATKPAGLLLLDSTRWRLPRLDGLIDGQIRPPSQPMVTRTPKTQAIEIAALSPGPAGGLSLTKRRGSDPTVRDATTSHTLKRSRGAVARHGGASDGERSDRTSSGRDATVPAHPRSCPPPLSPKLGSQASSQIRRPGHPDPDPIDEFGPDVRG